MQSIKSKVTSKGQIVIPKIIRDKYGIHSKTSIYWIQKREGILIVPDSGDPINKARGMLKNSGLLQKYIKEKRAEKEREHNKYGENRKVCPG